MHLGDWLEVPVGRDASKWVTVKPMRTVLVVIHTVAGAGHLLDAVELIEDDTRIQVVFTQAPDLFHNGVAELMRDLRGAAVPWLQAIQSDFDLALAADCACAHQLSAPVLSLPHGVMNNKLAPEALGGPTSGLVVGLAFPWLTWYGRLVPATVALSHVDLLELLAQQCPQATSHARVVGDLCLDRLVASRADRQRYRAALGIEDDRTLVMLSSTWGEHSMFARSRMLLAELLADLPRTYAVIVALHPALWFGHGPRQVMAWLRQLRRDGVRVVEPLSWRGLAAAADVVVGDHGSATVYAAAAGVPVLRATNTAQSAPGRSAVARLAEIAPVLTVDEPLTCQVDRMPTASRLPAAIASRVTSEPGRAAKLLRAEMYRLLRLPEPAAPPETAPVAVARLATE